MSKTGALGCQGPIDGAANKELQELSLTSVDNLPVAHDDQPAGTILTPEVAGDGRSRPLADHTADGAAVAAGDTRDHLAVTSPWSVSSLDQRTGRLNAHLEETYKAVYGGCQDVWPPSWAARERFHELNDDAY